MESVAEVGAYLVDGIRAAEKAHGETPTTNGMGLLIGSKAMLPIRSALGTARPRYMPPLDLTKKDVDQLLSQLQPPSETPAKE